MQVLGKDLPGHSRECTNQEFEFRRNMDLRNDGVVETEDDLDGIRERTY